MRSFLMTWSYSHYCQRRICFYQFRRRKSYGTVWPLSLFENCLTNCQPIDIIDVRTPLSPSCRPLYWINNSLSKRELGVPGTRPPTLSVNIRWPSIRNCFNSDKVAEVSYASTCHLLSNEVGHSDSWIQRFRAKIALYRNSGIVRSCWNIHRFVQRLAQHNQHEAR
jgi:hypothetical protein